MSGSVPRYDATETVRREGVVNVQGGTAMAALSQSMDRLGAVLGNVGEGMARNRRQSEMATADQEVRTMALRDAEGRLVYPEERDWQNPAGAHFNRGALLRIADETAIDARSRAVAIRAEAGNDPERFRQAWDSYAQSTLSSAPQWLRSNLQTTLGRLGGEHLGSVALQTASVDRHNQGEAWQMQQRQMQSDLESLAAAGRMDSPEYQAREAELGRHMQAGVAARHIAPEAAGLVVTNAQERAAERAVTRRAMETMSRDGPEAALTEFDRVADQRNMPPQQRERMRSLVEGRANEWRALRGEQRSELNTSADDWQTRITGGVPVAPDEGQRLAAEAERLGQPRLAQRIRDTQAVYTDLQDARNMSTGSLIQRRAAIEARLTTQGATARDVHLAELLGRMVTQRQEAMRLDPLGTAVRIHGQRQEVGTLPALDSSSPAALTASLQARMGYANRLGALEGVRNMPVLTAQERAGLTDVIQNGNRDQQVAILTSLTNGLGASGMSRTLDSLFPGTQQQNDPRLNAWIGAAGAAARGDMRLATEILSGAERMRTMRGEVPALSGNVPDRLIESTIGQAYGASPQALAAMREAARALYVERTATGRDATDPNRQAAPSSAGAFDASIMRRVLEQVAPVVSWNGQSLPPPRAGVTSTQFAEEIAALPPAALAGARAVNGGVVTPQMIRSGGRLIATGNGQYRVQVAGHDVLNAEGGPFVLDMRQRWPAATESPLPAGTGAYYERLGAQESGWNATIRSATSSATGHFQFIAGTWRAFAAANPQHFQGMGPEQIMAARTNPRMQLLGARWLAGTTADALTAAGQPVNDATVALGHAVGGGGAVSVMRAPATADLGSVIGEQAMTANPSWRGQTVGQFRARFIRRFGDGQTWREAPG